MHRGNDLFGNGHAALDALKRKRRRLRSTTPLRAAVDMVLDRAQLRSSSVAPSEVSLAFQPTPREQLRRRVGEQGGGAQIGTRRWTRIRSRGRA